MRESCHASIAHRLNSAQRTHATAPADRLSTVTTHCFVRYWRIPATIASSGGRSGRWPQSCRELKKESRLLLKKSRIVAESADLTYMYSSREIVCVGLAGRDPQLPPPCYYCSKTQEGGGHRRDHQRLRQRGSQHKRSQHRARTHTPRSRARRTTAGPRAGTAGQLSHAQSASGQVQGDHGGGHGGPRPPARAARCGTPPSGA